MGIPHPVHALRRAAQRARRFAELSRIAAQYGLSGIGSSGQRPDMNQLSRQLRPALEQAGPIFVKLGQVLSTRTDLLPQQVTAELASLQDQVPPAPWPQIKTVLEQERMP